MISSPSVRIQSASDYCVWPAVSSKSCWLGKLKFSLCSVRSIGRCLLRTVGPRLLLLTVQYLRIVSGSIKSVVEVDRRSPRVDPVREKPLE